MTITRFAPSPTGTLHIGGVRTALFNYIYAKQNNGKFLVRIEDTDQVRSKPEFEENIINGLHDMGLKPCLLYTSPSPRDISGSRMPSSA